MHELSISDHIDVLASDISPDHTNSTTVEGLDAFFDVHEMPEKGLTIEEACIHFRLPIKKLKRRIRSGEIEAIRLGFSDKPDDWRIFPNGIPGAFTAAGKVFEGKVVPSTNKDNTTPAKEKKNNDKKKAKKDPQRKEALQAIEGELASLRCDLTSVDHRLNNALDTLSVVNYELDVMKQLIAQVGITTTWLNNRLLEVQVDRKAIERFPTTALITVNETVEEEAEPGETQISVVPKRKQGSWIGGVFRWLHKVL